MRPIVAAEVSNPKVILTAPYASPVYFLNVASQFKSLKSTSSNQLLYFEDSYSLSECELTHYTKSNEIPPQTFALSSQVSNTYILSMKEDLTHMHKPHVN